MINRVNNDMRLECCLFVEVDRSLLHTKGTDSDRQFKCVFVRVLVREQETERERQRESKMEAEIVFVTQ